MSKERIYMLVTGQSGYGKSYAVKKYIIPILARRKPTIVFDILGEYAGKKAKDVPGTWASYSSFDDFLQYMKKSKRLLPGVHVVAWKNDSTIIKGINFFRRLEKPVSLVFEECHSLYSDPELSRKIKKPLKELTMYGRHFGIDCILITQRPKNLSTDMRSQIPFAVSFKQTLQSDLNSLDEIEEGVSKKIVALDKKEFYSFGEPYSGVFPELKVNQKNKL